MQPRLWVMMAAVAVNLWSQTPTRNIMAEGEAAFRLGNLGDAIRLFQEAAAASPSDPTPHLYMAAAYVQQIVPARSDAETQQLATNAERELQAALGIQPDNLQAMQSLATLHYNLAAGKKDHNEKVRSWDEASYWYRKITSAEPDHKTAHYSLGVIAWAKSYPELMQARQKLGMRPEDPGPLRIMEVRADLASRIGGTVEEGMRHLQRALEIDPSYDDAMAYLNLMHRIQGDLAGSEADHKQHVLQADEWVKRALTTKASKAQRQVMRISQSRDGASVPPPPPPGSTSASSDAGIPKQIRISGQVQSAKLLDRVQPQYPPLALQARIQGAVRFSATITKEGSVGQLTLIGGHPLLVPAAAEAARRYRYQPTSLNGQPVEVLTELEVNFDLP